MSTQEFSQAIVLLESQITASYIEDSQTHIDQMPPDSDDFEVPPTVPLFVLAQPNAVVISICAAYCCPKYSCKGEEGGQGEQHEMAAVPLHFCA